MEITPEIVAFIKEVSFGAASGRLQEKAQDILASIEAAQQDVQDVPIFILGEPCPTCGGTDWQCANCLEVNKQANQMLDKMAPWFGLEKQKVGNGKWRWSEKQACPPRHHEIYSDNPQWIFCPFCGERL